MSDSEAPPEVPAEEYPQEVIDEMLRLYNVAYNEHRNAGRNASAESAQNQKALAYSYDNNIPGVEELLNAVVSIRRGSSTEVTESTLNGLSKLPSFLAGHALQVQGLLYNAAKQYEEAIASCREALDTPRYDTPSHAWSCLGASYYWQKEYDKATECFEKAIVMDGHDCVGHEWNNLGIVNFLSNNWEKAIQCYQNALSTIGYETPGDAWFNLGLLYRSQKDYDRAIDCYRKALETRGFDTPGDAWNDLGVTYAEQKEYNKAIDCYEKALETPRYGSKHLTKINLANSFRSVDAFSDALQLLDEVLSEPDNESEHARAKSVRQLVLADLADLKSDPEDEVLARSEKPSVDRDSPESRMEAKLQGLQDQYEAYNKRQSSPRDDTFSVLRDWSSAVTLLEGSTEGRWRGGGYFFKWCGVGVVIDPGFDFLDNFHDEGFHARELDTVLVSHNHSDHNFDLHALCDLRYEIFRRSVKKNEEGKMRPTLRKSVFVIDEDTAKAFDNAPKDHRGSPFRFTQADSQNKRWIEGAHSKLPMTIEHFPVKHGDDVPNAVGIRLRLHRDKAPDFVIGYTGDTKYFESLCEQLQNCDLLIAHISQPDAREFENEEHEKPYHLGYNGVTKLIRETQPKLTLIGEFWAGLADLRIELIQGLRRRTQNENILPASMGMHLSLPEMQVECTECGNSVSHSHIRIVPPTYPFGPLGNICGNCMA